VVISPDVLFHVLQQGTAWRVERGIPAGSVLCGITNDPLTMNLNLFVEHEDFPEVNLETEVSTQIEILCKKV
jgi:hypothetical protein